MSGAMGARSSDSAMVPPRALTPYLPSFSTAIGTVCIQARSAAPRAKKDQASYVRNPRNHNFPWDDPSKPFVVPPGRIFMMGDNRYNSMDSRYWGALDLKLIKGKAMFLYWSWDGQKHLPRFSRLGRPIH